MAKVRLSARNQIVIPKAARQALGLKAGDTLLVVVRGRRVIVLERPESHHTAIRGLAAQAYPDAYLEQERRSWD